MKSKVVLLLTLLLAAHFTLDNYVLAQSKQWKKSDFERLIVGRTRKQVRQMIGRPDKIERNGLSWFYINPKIIDEQTGTRVAVVRLDWSLKTEGKVKGAYYP